MVIIWLAALLLGSGFAIVGAQGLKLKLLNLVIVLGCMGVGLVIGYVAGLGSEDVGRVRNAALPLSMMFGIVGALGCVRLNNWRVTANKV